MSFLSFHFSLKCNEWVCFGLHWVFLAARDGCLLLVVSGGARQLVAVASLVVGQELWTCGPCAGLSDCGSWAQQLWLPALVAPQHVESTWTWVGRQIRILCTTREVRVLRGSVYSFPGVKDSCLLSAGDL